MSELDPRGQSRYQIRFDFGPSSPISSGADVLVLVDAIRVDDALLPPTGFDGPVLEATLGNAVATAEWVLAQQHDKGDRFAVAVIAVGADGGFCVEDLLVAGLLMDALADLGIDYASPEAASAVAASQGLRRAVSHILSASVSGQRLLAEHGQGAIERIRERQDGAEVIRLS
ncbi:MAG: 2-phosphosulfolactate phosphatase [Naasia sp.]